MIVYLVDIVDSLQDTLAVVLGLILVTELKSLVDTWWRLTKLKLVKQTMEY